MEEFPANPHSPPLSSALLPALPPAHRQLCSYEAAQVGMPGKGEWSLKCSWKKRVAIQKLQNRADDVPDISFERKFIIVPFFHSSNWELIFWRRIFVALIAFYFCSHVKPCCRCYEVVCLNVSLFFVVMPRLLQMVTKTFSRKKKQDKRASNSWEHGSEARWP